MIKVKPAYRCAFDHCMRDAEWGSFYCPEHEIAGFLDWLGNDGEYL